MKLSQLPDSVKSRFFNNTCSEREYMFIITLLHQSDQEEVDIFMEEHRKAITEGRIQLDKSPGPEFSRIQSQIMSQVQDVRRKTMFWVSIPIAASFLFFALLFFTGRSDRMYQELSAIRESRSHNLIDHYTAFGKQSNIDLQDGSRVTISSGSRLIFPEKFYGEKREIQLDGQAFFRISKDSIKPFIIHSRGLKVEVLGTSFNVTSYDEDRYSRITVVEGSVGVEISNGGEYYVLGMDDEFYYDKETGSVAVSRVDAMESIGWIDGILIFDNIGLREVFKQLERWYDVKFEFNVELPEECLVSGQHENEGLSKVLEALSFTHGVDYEYLASGKIRINALDCK